MSMSPERPVPANPHVTARSSAEARVLGDLVAECARQDARWGAQDHPNGTGPATTPLYGSRHLHEDMDAQSLAQLLRFRNQARFAGDEATPGTWRDILLEEVFEALAEDDPEALRAELIQVAAVSIQWAQLIDRRLLAEIENPSSGTVKRDLINCAGNGSGLVLAPAKLGRAAAEAIVDSAPSGA